MTQNIALNKSLISSMVDAFDKNNSTSTPGAMDISIVLSTLGERMSAPGRSNALGEPARSRDNSPVMLPNWHLTNNAASARDELDASLVKTILHALKYNEICPNAYFTFSSRNMFSNPRESMALISLWIGEAFALMV